MLQNRNKPAWRIYHKDLERQGRSPYRSQCPACEPGILFVYRDPITLTLRRGDRCSHCGQRYYYLDTAIANEALPLAASVS
jgi:uncharacterized protein (DUF983 family)